VIIFPAIDLKNGACVRLRQGAMESATAFPLAPAEQARAWQDAGFRWLHVVDLDGAFAGHAVNRAAVLAILRAVRIPVQLGGGIRSLDDIAAWLEAGVARVILGSLAARAPDVARAACRQFPGRIVLGIDARDGRVAVQGWAATEAIGALDLAARFADAGAAAIVFTDIARDGMLGGVNVAATEALAERVAVPVIASGGVAGVADLLALRAASGRVGGRIEGVVIGRALYDGRIAPAAALAAAREPAQA
jgi:phosphoribosylformimino-5-aminoimidazole carboxamide ribotide isomerase